jgi:hypothetical protein
MLSTTQINKIVVKRAVQLEDQNTDSLHTLGTSALQFAKWQVCPSVVTWRALVWRAAFEVQREHAPARRATERPAPALVREEGHITRDASSAAAGISAGASPKVLCGPADFRPAFPTTFPRTVPPSNQRV